MTGAPGVPDLAVSLGDTEAFSGSTDPPSVAVRHVGDGCDATIERGRAGDLAIRYGDRATFLVDLVGGTLRCAPVDPAGQDWRRFLLDTVLGSAALAVGFEALHAGAVVAPAGVVAVAAETGGGKSTLIAELVTRGHDLFTDDVLALGRGDGSVLAHPGPPVMNLAPGAPRVGSVVAELEGESWVKVTRRPPAPAVVAAVVLLARGGTTSAVVEELTPSPAVLLEHSLSSGPGPGRLRARFELLGDLAASSRLLRVAVPVTHPPAAIADLLLVALG